LDQKRIPELDGIRGVAVLMVVLYHYAVIGPGAPFHTFLYRLRNSFRLGWSGVDLFFVLSGFLIGGILLDARTSKRYFHTFYARRSYRILPIYYLWLILFPIGVLVYSRWGIPYLAQDPQMLLRLPLHYVFLQTLTYPFLPAARTVGWYWLGPTWSVAVEEQFYLVVAPLVRLLSTRKLVLTLLGTIVVCPFLRLFVYFGWSHSTLFVLLMPCRADSFATGMLAAILWKTPASRLWLIEHRKWINAALAFLFLGPLVFTKWSPSMEDVLAATFKLQWLSVFFACLILAVLADCKGKVAGLMRWSFLREMGRLSYCIYLIHLSILAGCFAFFLHSYPTMDTAASFGTLAIAALLTYALAWISWRFLENPMLRRGHAFKY
jgi:peptidoglycan/LPS O-acetylase OafA/YrhL